VRALFPRTPRRFIPFPWGRRAVIFALLGGCFWASPFPARAGENPLKKSVVKIFCVINRPNYYQPWVMGYQFNASGSGCILPGNRILTNAHVVSNQVFLQVMKAGDTRKYTAQVEYVDHDREVAVLKVKDPEFFKGTQPVRFGALPSQRDKVAVYGFPVGGDELSITEGVVSRIEVQEYVHSQRNFLTIQTDAAINPGNSGGPAFKGNKMIGIAFQAFSGSEVQDTGYIVPAEIIRESLRDMKDKVMDGAPDLGFYWQKMESPSLRSYYKMKAGQTGILVTRVAYDSPSWGLLQDEDVVLSIAGVPVADNGTVPFRNGDRLDFSYEVSRYQMGQTLVLGVLRDGRPKKLLIKLKPFDTLVPGPQYDVRPSYYIFGGLVFMPLTVNYLQLWKSGTAPVQLEDLYENGNASENRRQVVFINEVLPHDINVGYHNLKQAVVVKVNGRPISKLSDVVEAFQHPLGGYHVIELDHPVGEGDNFGNWVVLKAKGASEATKEILKSFGITSDRSDDLKEQGKKGPDEAVSGVPAAEK
jgi:S1-C subfamily serine protease